MHTEDKLTAEQRLRLEALNQAVSRYNGSMAPASSREVLGMASDFAEFLITGSKSVGKRAN